MKTKKVFQIPIVVICGTIACILVVLFTLLGAKAQDASTPTIGVAMHVGPGFTTDVYKGESYTLTMSIHKAFGFSLSVGVEMFHQDVPDIGGLLILRRLNDFYRVGATWEKGIPIRDFGIKFEAEVFGGQKNIVDERRDHQWKKLSSPFAGIDIDIRWPLMEWVGGNFGFTLGAAANYPFKEKNLYAEINFGFSVEFFRITPIERF